MSTPDDTVVARLDDGRELPVRACSCGSCKNEWFMVALSDEWVPSFCPYCGIRFVSRDLDGEWAPFLPKKNDS